MSQDASIFSIILFCKLFVLVLAKSDDKDPDVIPPTKCEACKILAIELKERFKETGKSKEIIRTGHGLDGKKKKEAIYHKSELRLIETLHEPQICDRILKYNVHKERKGSLRFAKGISETFETLYSLRNRGVEVKMDLPEELWNKTSAEVSILQRMCSQLVEDYEDDIEEWYYNHQDSDLTDYLCKDIVLKDKNYDCLYEVFIPDDSTADSVKKDEGKSKKDTKKKSKKKKSTSTKKKDEL